MATANAQMWQGSKFNVERVAGDLPGEVIFRFTGPFTARDMYGSISPAAFSEILHSRAGADPPTTHILDLACVPYIDSAGLGMIVDHLSKCQQDGIQIIAVGAGTHVIEQFRLTKIDTLFPVAGRGSQSKKMINCDMSQALSTCLRWQSDSTSSQPDMSTNADGGTQNNASA